MGCAGRCLGGYGGRPGVGGTSFAAECTDACDPVHKWQHLLWPCSNSCSGKDPSPTAPLKPTFPIAPSNQTLSGGEPCVGKIVEGPAASRLEATQPSEQQPQSGSAEQHAASPAPQAPAAANKTAAGAHAKASTGDGPAADAAEQQAASPEKRSAAAAAAPHVSTRAEANTGGTQAARAPAPDVSALEQQVQQQAGEIARLQAQAALIPGLQQQVALLPGLQQQMQLLTTAVLAQQQLQQERQGWQQVSESLQCQMQELLQIAREGQQPRTVPRPAGAGGRR